MKTSTKLFLVIFVIASMGILAAAMVKRSLDKKHQVRVETNSSDAKPMTDTIRFAADSWAGYSIFRSTEFSRVLENEGIGFNYKDDQAAYTDRMAKLASGEHDIIVTTLDSYLVHGKKYDYPGVIVFVVDESKGGDGIVAKQEVKTIVELGQPGIKIALTPDSPSDFLLRAVATQFDLGILKGKGDWRKETAGSKQAYKELQAGNVSAAVLWEPDLTEATSDPRFHRLIGTEKTAGLILDVCVFNRKFVVDKPNVALTFVRSYFQTHKAYTANADNMIKLVAKDSKVSEDKAKMIYNGISFASFARNLTYWYGLIGEKDADPAVIGVTREHLLESMRSNIEVLVECGLVSTDPTNGNPRRLLNSSFLETLKTGLTKTSGIFKGEGVQDSLEKIDMFTFAKLTDEQWNALKMVGTLKTRPIVFQSGNAILELSGKQGIDRMVADLAHWPSYRLIVRGHTSPEGDEEVNVALSSERAQVVANYLHRVHQIPEERMKVEGKGGTVPLPKDSNESHRRWTGRQPRVELLLVEDPNIQ